MTAAQRAHVHGLTSALFRLSVGPSRGQSQMADVYIDDFGHVAQGGQSELECGEGPDVDSMRRVDVFHANRQIPQSVHKAVRSEVASATLWGAEIRGIDGSVACSPSPTRLLPLSGTACVGSRRYASRGAVRLGLLGDIVLVSSGGSLYGRGRLTWLFLDWLSSVAFGQCLGFRSRGDASFGHVYAAPSQAPSGHPWSITRDSLMADERALSCIAGLGRGWLRRPCSRYCSVAFWQTAGFLQLIRDAFGQCW